MEIELNHIFSIAIPIIGFAAAFGGIKYGLNGMKEQVREINHKQDKLLEATMSQGERISSLETEVKILSTR